jgi:hypothetical protein
MNARALNALAGVIAAAMRQDRTPMGIALAIESAGLLQSPESAAELVALRAERDPRRDESVAKLRMLLGHQQEDPHDSPLHHPYTTARLREDEGADDGR